MKAIVRHKFLRMPQIIKEMNSKLIFLKAKIHQLELRVTLIQIQIISIDFKVASLEKLRIFKFKVKIHTIRVAKVIPLKF